jgi:aminopeptidase N
MILTCSTIKIDAQNMEFSDLKLTENRLIISILKNNYKSYPKGKNNLTFHYLAKPKQTMYFVQNQMTMFKWTQGQGKYTSHWFPSFDDVNEKVILI